MKWFSIADTFGPGTHELATSNLPLLSTLQGWKHGFDSPFKAEVYFVATRHVTDLKWGTMDPVAFRDTELGLILDYAEKVADLDSLADADDDAPHGGGNDQRYTRGRPLLEMTAGFESDVEGAAFGA